MLCSFSFHRIHRVALRLGSDRAQTNPTSPFVPSSRQINRCDRYLARQGKCVLLFHSVLRQIGRCDQELNLLLMSFTAFIPSHAKSVVATLATKTLNWQQFQAAFWQSSALAPLSFFGEGRSSKGDRETHSHSGIRNWQRCWEYDSRSGLPKYRERFVATLENQARPSTKQKNSLAKGF